MTLIRHIQAGIIQQLQIYRNFPMRLIVSILPVIDPLANILYSRALVSIGLFKEEPGSSLPKFINPIHTLFSLVLIISEMIYRRQTNLEKFMNINGMSKSAYIIKMVLTYYLLFNLGSIPGIIDYSIRNSYTTGQIWSFICYTLVVNAAAVNNAFLVSRFLTLQQSKYMSFVFSFSFVAALICAANISNTTDVLRYFIFVMNPVCAKVNLVTNGTQAEWNFASLIALALNLLYLSLNILSSLVQKIRKTRSESKEKQFEQVPVELSMALMDSYENIDPLMDLENANLGSSLIFEESTSKLNKKSVLRVANLTKVFEGSQSRALDNITLEFFDKEVICLIGHNGAGKTTLLNVLTGFITQTEGSIFYGNEEVSAEKIRQSFGFCSQDSIALTENTVYQNLAFMAKIKNVDQSCIDSEVQKVMEKFSLESYKDKIVY